jgi:hypothetical protein
VFWLRSSLLYLGVIALVAGTVWLFWGSSIESALKKPAAKEAVAATREKAKPLVSAVKKKVSTAIEQSPNAAGAWKTTQNGFEGLMAAQTHDNQVKLSLLVSSHTSRMHAIFSNLGITRKPLPSSITPDTTDAKKKNPPIRPGVQRPSKRPVK